jgi:hypothetical protein
LQGIQGSNCSILLQTLDNAANGLLKQTRSVKISEKLNGKIVGTNCHFTVRSKISDHELFFIFGKKTSQNFYEMFVLTVKAGTL